MTTVQTEMSKVAFSELTFRNLHFNSSPAVFKVLDGSIAYRQIEPTDENHGGKQQLRIPWCGCDASVKELDSAKNIILIKCEVRVLWGRERNRK